MPRAMQCRINGIHILDFATPEFREDVETLCAEENFSFLAIDIVDDILLVLGDYLIDINMEPVAMGSIEEQRTYFLINLRNYIKCQRILEKHKNESI